MEGDGEVMMKFALPSVIFRKKDDAKWKRDVGVQPHPADFHPFPTNGEYRFDDKYLSRVQDFIKLKQALDIRETTRIRYHQSMIEVYATNKIRTIVTRLPVDAEPELWDVPVPHPVVERLSRNPGIVIDHMHGYGTWFSDGRNFYFSQKSSAEVHDYSFDVPGVCRSVKAAHQSFTISPELWELIKSPGYYLLVMKVGCVKIVSLDPTTVNYHSNLHLSASKDISADYRGDPAALIVDSSKIAPVLEFASKVYVTPWPCAPYLIEGANIDVLLIPPAVNPGSLAEALGSDFQARGEDLRAWVGDYDGLVVKAFNGPPEHRVEANNTVHLHAPVVEEDALFLAKTPSGFKDVGGVGREALATCLFEFRHTTIYSRELIDLLAYGGYWPELQIYVYDPDHLETHGEDGTSPYTGWVGWDLWADPKNEQSRDGAGRPKKEGSVQEKRRIVRMRASALAAPHVAPPGESQENPDQNTVAEPIKETEEESGLIPQVTEEEPVACLLVDANFVTWRDFYVPGLQEMRHPTTGRWTGVAFGFVRSVRSWVKQFRPARICAIWDDTLAPWRKELIPDYKDRSKKKKEIPKDRLDSMFEQRGWLHNSLQHLGIHSIKIKGTEADDIIALLADAHAKMGRVVIVTGDHDFNQMVTDRIHVYQDRKNEIIRDPAVAPVSLLRKVIEGDTSDKIPGVGNVGKGTLDKYIQELREAGKEFTLETIAETAEGHSNYRVRKLATAEAKERIQRNLEMIDLRKGVRRLDPASMTDAITASFQTVQLNHKAFGQWVQELAFNSVLNDISSWHQDFGSLR